MMTGNDGISADGLSWPERTFLALLDAVPGLDGDAATAEAVLDALGLADVLVAAGGLLDDLADAAAMACAGRAAG